MKKLIILALVLAPAVSMAQVTDDVNVSATIAAAITVSTTTDMVFGTIADTSAVASISIANVTSNTGSTATRGEVTITGAAVNVEITVPSTVVITGPSSNTMTVNLTYGYSATDYATAGANSYVSGSPVPLTGGDGFLVVGGTIPAAQFDGKVAGAYTGSLTVSVIYE